MIRFAHKGDKAMEGMVGEISCLSQDSAGIVSVTGTITRSGKRDRKMPGLQTAAASDDDGTALLDELAPWDADEAAEDPAVPSLPGQDPNKDKKDPNKDKDPNKKGPDRGKRGGGELAGKDFAFTIDVPGKPQHFSQPTIGDKGTLAACSGGGAPVEVTRGGFRARGADGKSEGDKNDGDKKGDHRHGPFGWRR